MEYIISVLKFEAGYALGSIMSWIALFFLFHVYLYYMITWGTMLITSANLITLEQYHKGIEEGDKAYNEDHRDSI